MTLYQEASSWFSPSPVALSEPPQIGSKAPSHPELSFPAENGNPTIVSFLRHCGCPVAEATFLSLRDAATNHPTINFIAISHSSRPSTDKWLNAIGGAGNVTVLVDEERTIYASWGLGTTSWSHVLNPAGMVEIFKLGREKGIWNRPTESGSRWQGAGCWGVDGEGVVRWGGAARRADEAVDVDQAIEVLRG